MAKCGCGFTTDSEGNCNGTHKVVKKVRSMISENILKWHTPEDNTTACCYGDCTHEEDASVARGETGGN